MSQAMNELRTTDRRNHPVSVLVLLGLCMMMAGGIVTIPACAVAQISDDQAIAIANKEMVKFDIDSARWAVRLDKDRHDWQLTRESWERWVKTEAQGRAADTKARIEEIETAMKGKEVWLAVYNRILPPEKRARHSHAIVFLDAKTGNILAVINPEE